VIRGWWMITRNDICARYQETKGFHLIALILLQFAFAFYLLTSYHLLYMFRVLEEENV
jgi:hypothetical protein